jgi:hypothetical protein
MGHSLIGNHRVGAAAAVAGVSRRVEGQADAIAIMPGLGGQDCRFRRRGTPPRSRVSRRMACLKASCVCVFRVLIVAAAAGAKVRAGGRMRSGACGDDLLGFGGGVAALVCGDAHARLLAGQRERHKDGLAFNAGQECAAVDGLFDFDDPQGLKPRDSLSGTG